MSAAKRTDSDCFDRSERCPVDRPAALDLSQGHEAIRQPMPSGINEGPAPISTPGGIPGLRIDRLFEAGFLVFSVSSAVVRPSESPELSFEGSGPRCPGW
jgi:hypothetical protein